MPNRIALLLVCVLFFSGCAHIAPTPAVPVVLYERVAEAFVMLAREDVKDGESVWCQASGVAVAGEDGRHFIYTARHILFDKDNGGALPTRLYATLMTGESVEINLAQIETPELNHDAVRIEMLASICRELRLADRKPRYGETLFVFGDARGAGVMCADAGKVMAIGPLEFEHDVDTIKGMSGGPVLTEDGEVIGLCAKGRVAGARSGGVEVKSDSRYLRLRNFATVLHNINWQKFTSEERRY